MGSPFPPHQLRRADPPGIRIDGFMGDSDPSNIERVGHRRWIINPRMKQVGFGFFEGYVALWAMDTSRARAPDYDYLSFPAKGFHPVEFFRSDWAWSVSLNPLKYEMPKQKPSVSVYSIDEFGKPFEPLKLNYDGLSSEYRGTPSCIIFRPELKTLKPGSRFLVRIEGIARKDGSPAVIAFVVEFF